MTIKPLVVVSLLSFIFNPSNVKIDESQASKQEIILSRVIENIIKDSVKYNLHTEEEYTLLFEDDYSDTLPQDIEEDDELYKDYAEVPACLPNKEDVDFEYKKQAVEYWQSGKKDHYPWKVYSRSIEKLLPIVSYGGGNYKLK